MANDLGDHSLAPGSNLAVETLKYVESSCSELPSPTLIPETMAPELFDVKRRDGSFRVSDEASGSMGV